jgi:hypothetical protein
MRLMKRNIVAILLGVVVSFILFLVLTLLETIFPFYVPNPFHEGNGFLSYGALVAYFLGGVLVGIIAKKATVFTALACSIVISFIVGVIEMPDWAYYFGYAKHAIQFQPQMLTYYGTVFIVLIITMGIGGLLGKVMKTFFKVK